MLIGQDDEAVSTENVDKISAAQCRGARGLLDMTQPDLARAAGLGLSTIVDFERSRRDVSQAANAAIRRALETAGHRIHRGKRRRSWGALPQACSPEEGKGRAPDCGTASAVCSVATPVLPRFSRHSRMRAGSSSPLMIRASEPPMKWRRSAGCQCCATGAMMPSFSDHQFGLF